jgi:hypothetical protein
MVTITKRFFALIILFSLLFSIAPLHHAQQNTVSATTLPSSVDTSAVLTTANPDVIILINEVMFRPSIGEYEWVELKNIGPGGFDLSRFLLTDEDDHWYQFPYDLPPIPEGALVVVTFDGAGSASDEYNFTDNVAYLHSQPGLIDIFEDDQDQVALYEAPNMLYLPLIIGGNDSIALASTAPRASTFSHFPEDLIRFVAWGDYPLEDSDHAEYKGLWNSAWYVSLSLGLGVENPIEMDNFSIGLLPNSQLAFMADWELFLPSTVTKGVENECPIISWYYPADGALLDSDTLSVSWNAINQATNYHFQMDDQDDFSSPIVDVDLTYPAFISTTAIPDGFYYWRVQVTASTTTSVWSAVHTLETFSRSALLSSSGDPSGATREVRLPIAWQLQHKDTNMLCLDGDQENGNYAWDIEHEGHNVHGDSYCARATMSMMASYYDSNLSQDRISHEVFGNGGPEGDLGHGRGLWDWQIDLIINWSLDMPIARQEGKPSFDDIVAWIDEGRPIYSVTPGHARLINDYDFCALGGAPDLELIHLLDPWDRAKWVKYDDDNISAYWVGPPPPGSEGAPEVVMEEDLDADGIPDTMDDSDGDGIVDFDERERFNTLYNNPDSDGDGVPDKKDLREYVFNSTGDYNYRNPDWDHDGLRKEVDPDNDNGGSLDGWEDFNHNGIFEPALGETNNFDNDISSERIPIVYEFDCSTATDVPQIECEALVAFYNSTNGDQWDSSGNWLFDTCIDCWMGVGVEDGHVTSLFIREWDLSGLIPPELNNLSYLKYLYLGYGLVGSIPPELGTLSNLIEISLSYNQLSGAIPPELGNLHNLRTLWLEDNNLSGPLPESLGNLSNLISLDIWGNNQLTGSIPLSFVNLTKLWEFYFYETQLCEPSTPEFLAWKRTVSVWQGTDVTCP